MLWEFTYNNSDKCSRTPRCDWGWEKQRENDYTMYTEHTGTQSGFFSWHLHREQSGGKYPLCPICSVWLIQEQIHEWSQSEPLGSFISSLISGIAYGIRQRWIKPHELYREFCLEKLQAVTDTELKRSCWNSTQVQVTAEIYNLRFAHRTPSYKMACSVKKKKKKLKSNYFTCKKHGVQEYLWTIELCACLWQLR